MILYLSSTKTTLDCGYKAINARGDTPNLLMSYFYFKAKNVAEIAQQWAGARIFGDSGAFSAWSLGTPLVVDDYAAWLVKYGAAFEAYANLDVKGDIDASLRNQEYLEAQGLSPIPVFHMQEPWEVLDDMVAKYPYIALGGMAGGPSGHKSTMRWLIQCFRKAQGKSVFHGFGMTNIAQMKAFPWYSVDSSSWTSAARYGAVRVWDTNRHRWLNWTQRDYQAFQKHANVIARLGYDWREFYQTESPPSKKLNELAAVSFFSIEKWLTALHGEVKIPQR